MLLAPESALGRKHPLAPLARTLDGEPVLAVPMQRPDPDLLLAPDPLIVGPPDVVAADAGEGGGSDGGGAALAGAVR